MTGLGKTALKIARYALKYESAVALGEPLKKGTLTLQGGEEVRISLSGVNQVKFYASRHRYSLLEAGETPSSSRFHHIY